MKSTKYAEIRGIRRFCALVSTIATLGAFTGASATDAYIASTTDASKKYKIDTGYLVGPDTGIEADFEFLATTEDKGKYQQFVYEAGSEIISRVYINGSEGKGELAWNCSSNGLWNTTKVTMKPNVRYKTLVDPSIPLVKLEANGEEVYYYNQALGARPKKCSKTLKIFNGASDNNHAALMKLYRFKIYEKGVLQHDYVPSQKADRPGLYDIYGNGGFITDDQMPSKTFYYGGTLKEVEDDGYVMSDGTCGVNSRYFFNKNSRIEVDYALTDTKTAQQRIFGRDTVGPMSSFYVQGNLNLAFGSGDTFVYSDTQTGIKADTLRHTAILDVKNKKASLLTGRTTNWANNSITANHVPTSSSTVPIGVFADTINDKKATGFVNYAKTKIYGVRFYTNGNLVHNYVPCVRGGIAGFKDEEDHQFITSETAGDLKFGGKIQSEPDDGYIANNGKAWLDTGYTPTPKTRVEIDYMCESVKSGNRIFSAYSSGNLYFLHYINTSTNYAWCCMDGDGNWTSTVVPVFKHRRRKFILDPNKDFAGVVTAGYTNYNSTVSGPVNAKGGTYVKSAGSTLKICCDSNGSNVSNIRLYGLKIYEAGTLKRDYTPRVVNGEAGLYDNVGKTFKGSACGYAFTAGGNIATEGCNNDAFLQSDATQGINTGYLMKGPNTRIEADFSFLDINKVGNTGNYQQRVFGQDTGGGLLYSCYINGNGCFSFGFGNAFNIRPSSTADMKRHKAIIDGKNGVAKLITGGTTQSYSYSAVAHGNTSSWPMGIFATPNDQAATAWRNPSAIKLYSLRVYEDGTLKHEYLPYKKGDEAGLYDTVDKTVLKNSRSGAHAFVVGGKGVDGKEKWLRWPENDKETVTPGEKSKTLEVNACGATSYKWKKNGKPISDGANGELKVDWVKGHVTDTYSVTPVYSVYGKDVNGVEKSFTVEHMLRGTMLRLD